MGRSFSGPPTRQRIIDERFASFSKHITREALGCCLRFVGEASDVFGDSWETFIDISFDELEDRYKTYSSLREELDKIVMGVSLFARRASDEWGKAIAS